MGNTCQVQDGSMMETDGKNNLQNTRHGGHALKVLGEAQKHENRATLIQALKTKQSVPRPDYSRQIAGSDTVAPNSL